MVIPPIKLKTSGLRVLNRKPLKASIGSTSSLKATQAFYDTELKMLPRRFIESRRRIQSLFRLREQFPASIIDQQHDFVRRAQEYALSIPTDT